jgi:hypothetical protein
METIRISPDNKKVLALLDKIKQRKQEVKAEMKNSPFVKKLKSAAREGGQNE